VADMIGAIVAAAAGVAAVPVAGGLAYRKSRQRRVAQALVIDTPNGIVEERFVRVGGIDQWIQIRGEDRDNPVLLVLHGGPGWPNAVFTLPLRPWEQHFTVVQWDHRGAGKTLGRNGKVGSGEMTFGRRVADAVELVEFLRNYLHKAKVILLAESMGTLTGMPLVKQRPELFHALVVTDLYVDVARNEALKYQMTLERLRAADKSKAVAALERIGADPTRPSGICAPGARTWRGRSERICLRPIWIGNCCFHWRCRPRSTRFAIFTTCSWGSNGPQPRCMTSSSHMTLVGWALASMCHSSSSRAKVT
jgi:pimeloyl-ACP methyl ester carboxylesterase